MGARNLSKTVKESRELNRVALPLNHGFSARLEFPNATVNVRVLDMSVKGVGVELPGASSSVGYDPTQVKTLRLYYGTRQIAEVHDPKLIRFNSSSNTAAFMINSAAAGEKGGRKGVRLNTSAHLTPVILAPDPLNSKHALHLTVIDFNSTGLLASTSLTNKHLLAGMSLDGAQILLPGLEIMSFKGLVRHTRISSQRLFLGIRFVDPSSLFVETLAQFALYGGVPTFSAHGARLEALKSSGFTTRKIAKSVKIEIVQSPQDYLDVLDVRFQAYKAAQKVDPNSTKENMADEFDDSSVIYCAKINGVVVGTFRLNFSHKVGEQFPFEGYFPFSSAIPVARSEVFEVSRLAILPEFQKTDLLLTLFRAVARDGAKAKKYLVMLATKSLRGMYFKLGSEQISAEVPHPMIENESLALLKLSTEDYIAGRKIRGLSWDIIVKDVAEHLSSFGFIERQGFNPRVFVLKHVESLLLAATAKKKSKGKKV